MTLSALFVSSLGMVGLILVSMAVLAAIETAIRFTAAGGGAGPISGRISH